MLLELFGLRYLSARAKRHRIRRRESLLRRRRYLFHPNLQALEPRQMLAVVNVAASDPNASETGPDGGAFTVTRDNYDSTPLTVYYMLGGSASYGTDYTGPSGSMGSITIPGGANSANVAITPVVDSLVEGAEYVQFNLYMGSYTVGTNSSAQVTIADGVVTLPTVTATATDPNASESGPDAGVYTISRTGSTAQPLDVYFSLGGTATQYSDYSASYSGYMGTLTIPMGASSATITINPQSDSLTEGNEAVMLTLNSSSSYTLGTPTTAQITIADAAPPTATVTVATTDGSASELNLDQGLFTITRTGSTSAPLMVYFNVSGSANGGSDYDSLPSYVTIPVGASSATVSVVPRRDNAVEGSESVTLNLSSNMYYTLGSTSSGTVSIADDPATVTIAKLQDASENGPSAGSVRIARVGGDINSPLSVSLSIGGTATPGSDYTALSSSVSIPTGQSSVDVSIAPIVDALSEGTETVQVSLAGNSSYTLGTTASATVNIVDGLPMVSVEPLAALALESPQRAAEYRFRRTGNLSQSLTVNYTVAGTANSADYGTLAGTVTFPVNQDAVDLSITPVNDGNPEPTESLIINLASGSGYAIASANSATAYIQDQPSAVSIAATDPTATETGPTTATFTVSLSSPTPVPLQVAYTAWGTAIASVDYQPLEGTVTILEGQSSATIVVTPITDSNAETAETVILTLGSGNTYTVATNSQATATIAGENDLLAVNIGDDATIVEGGTFTRTASFSDDGGQTWTVRINYRDGSPITTANYSAPQSFTLSHTYAQDGEYAVTAEVTANDGRIATDSLTLTVNNSAPVVTLGNAARVGQNQELSAAGSFVDAGVRDEWIATVDYGDGSGPQPLAIAPNGSFTLTHSFTQAGSYTASVAVSDDANATGTATLQIIVDAPPRLDLDANDDHSSGANYNATFVEDAGSIIVVDSDAVLSDVDSTQLTSLLVTLTTRQSVEETLSAITTGTAIEAIYENSTLRLTGLDTIANYQQVLRTVRYNNTAHGMVGTTRTIDFVASDGAGVSNTATTTISIQKVNDAPVTSSGSIVIEQNVNTQVVLGEDGDGETVQTLVLTIVTPPQHGVLSAFDPQTGLAWYTPAFDYIGEDSFSYYITDDGTAGSPADLVSQTVTRMLSVVRGNATPTANPIAATLPEDGTQSLTLTGNDGESDVVQQLTFAIVSPPEHGTLVDFNPATGAVVYHPDPNYFGVDSFEFVVSDDATLGNGARTSEPALVSLTITPVNDTPLVLSQQLGIASGTPRTILLGSDGEASVQQQLTLNIITPPQHGVLSGFNASTGSVVYTPNANYIGTDSFAFTLTDDDAAGSPVYATSANATVELTIAAAPTAQSGSFTILEDHNLPVTLIGSDGDPSAIVPILFAIVSGPEHGAIVDFDTEDGTFVYVPDADYNGAETISFDVSYLSPSGVRIPSAVATIQIAITPLNDAPIDASGSLVVAKNEAILITLGNDADPEVAQELMLTVITPPAHGTLSAFDPIAGTIIYTPAAEYTGTDQFAFTLTDDDAAGEESELTSEVGEFRLNVRPRPVAQALQGNVNEDTPWIANLSASPGSGGTLTYRTITAPEHGTVQLNPATGAFTYTSAVDYHGTDTFVVVAIEALNAVDEATLASLPTTIEVTIAAENDRPAGVEQERSLAEGESLAIQLTGIDNDPEVEQTLTYTILSGPTHGTIVDFDAETGELTYLPNEGFHGEDTFTYAVTDDATAGSSARTSDPVTIKLTVGARPTAGAINVSTSEDVAVAIALSATDEDTTTAARFAFLILTAPGHGELTGFDPETGELVYTPDADFDGTDSFTYTVVDQWATPDVPVYGETATVMITVTGVNDAPQVQSQIVETPRNAPLEIMLGDSGDATTQSLTLTITTPPQHGTLSDFDPVTGIVLYTPSADYLGEDTFSFTLTDDGAPPLTSAVGTISLTISDIDREPVANAQQISVAEDGSIPFTLSGNDGDPSVTQTVRYRIVIFPRFGQITAFNTVTGQGVYAPDANYNGADSFEFVVDDGETDEAGQTSQTATVSITVNAKNDAPVAKSQSLKILEDHTLVITLSGDGGDNAAEALVFALLTWPQHGTISGFDVETGQLTYTPNTDYVGTDSFTYAVSDDGSAGGPGGLMSAPQTITLTIDADHVAVRAAPVAATTALNQAVNLQLATTSPTAGATSLTFAITSGPSHGTITNLNTATGSFTYTPGNSYSGTDQFTFSVTDNRANVTSIAGVAVQVRAQTTLPLAVDDQTTARGETVLDVLENDSQGAAGGLQIIGFSSVAGGTVSKIFATPGATGTVERDRLKFVPTSSSTSGTYSFTYTVQDALGQQSTATVTLTVLADSSLPNDGTLSIGGGGGFDTDPNSSFTPTIVGNVWLTKTQTGGLQKTWTDPTGQNYSGTGTQITTLTVTATVLPNGMWTYTEVGTWFYDVTAGDVHLWGNYTYTFSAGLVAGTEYFTLTMNSTDNYSVNKTTSQGDANNGSATTSGASGSEQTTLFKQKTVNLLGATFVGRTTKTSTSNFNGTTNYWRNSASESVTGTANTNGSTYDSFSMNVLWSVNVLGGWLVTGSAIGNGNGNNNTNYGGGGTYQRDYISGAITENGNNNSNFNYSMNGTLQPSIEWSLSGTGQQRADKLSFTQYIGGGSTSSSGSNSGGSWSMNTNVLETGMQRHQDQTTLDLGLTGAGWAVTSGMATATGESSGFMLSVGSGTYSSGASGSGGYWSINGRTNELSIDRKGDRQTVISSYNGLLWTAVGNGSASGSNLYFRSNSGSGTFVNYVLDASGQNTGSVRGRKSENGSTLKTKEFNTTSLMANGLWVTAGSASGLSDVRASGSFSGSGSYVSDRVRRNAWQSGKEGSRNTSNSEWTLLPGDTWKLTGGSGSTDTSNENSGSYSGSGSYKETSATGMSGATGSGTGGQWSTNRITRWDSGSENSRFSNGTQMSVVNGAWVITSGSGSGSGRSQSSSSYSASGRYGYDTSTISVRGTSSGAGGNSLDTSYNLNSTYDPNAQSGSGGWITTGTSSGSSSSSGRSDSTGSGTFTNNQSSGRGSSSASGTVNEDNNSRESHTHNWTSTLSASGVWSLTGGSGSASGGGGNNFVLTGSGTNRTYIPDGSGSFNFRSEKHNSNDFQFRDQVVAGDWKTISGSGSASGSVIDHKDAQGSARVAVDRKYGQIHVRTSNSMSDDWNFSYKTNSTIVNGNWSTTGSATGSASGSTMSWKGVNRASYSRVVEGGRIDGWFNDFTTEVTNFNNTGYYTIDTNQDWKLTSGSGSSYGGEGIGQAYGGSGNYALAGAQLQSDGAISNWSLNGKINESGMWAVTAGEGRNWGVASGNWVVLSKSGSGTYDEREDFTNTASGNYTRGSISGSFNRHENDNFNSHYQFSMSGQGANAVGWAGSGSSHTSSTYRWSYSGSGSATIGETKGTLKEDGRGEDGSSEDQFFQRAGSGDWILTSGSSHQYDNSRAHAEYSGSGSYTNSIAATNGDNWITNGNVKLQWRETSTYDGSEDSKYLGGAWKQTAGSRVTENKTFSRSEYDATGTFSEWIEFARVNGTSSASGHDEQKRESKLTETFQAGGWSKVGSGSGYTDKADHSFASGSGAYVNGDIRGTIKREAETHSAARGDEQYKLFGDIWKAKGTGVSSTSGKAHMEFSGSGSYTRAIIGGTINGDSSESGSQDTSYDYNAGWKLGPNQNWVLTSGSGNSKASGEYNYSSSGSGSYTLSFDNDGVLNGTAEESQNIKGSYDYRYDATVVNNAWNWTGSGSGSGSSSGNYKYSGSGTRNNTSTNAYGSSQDNSELKESGQNKNSDEYKFDWQWNASGLSYNYDSTATTSSSGVFAYSASGSSDYTYSTGNFGAGNGSITHSTSSYNREHSEQFDWTSVRTEHERYASGVTSSWSDTVGSGSGSGRLYSKFDYQMDYQSATTSSNYSRTENGHSGSGGEMTDTYNFTANWSQASGSDGSQSYSASLTNQVAGSGQSWYSYGNAWTETYSYSGSMSGGSTNSSATNGGGSYAMPGYNQTVNYPGFYTSAYNSWRYGWSVGSVPASGNYSYSMPGTPPPSGSGSGSGGGGGGQPPPDPLAGGPWFVMEGTPGESGGLLADFGFIHRGAGQSTTIDEIADIKVDIPDPPSPYGNVVYEFLGENIIRPIVGDENLINASDFQLFLGTAAFATVLVVGIYLAPGAVATAAVAGAGIGAAYNIANQLDNGASFGTLDWGQVGKAALAGGITGGAMGAAFAIAAPLIPGFCTVATVMGVGMSAKSLYNAYNNFNDGNYYTASLDATLGVIGLYGAAKGMFGKMSQSVGGSCFVVGTQVVVLDQGNGVVTATEVGSALSLQQALLIGVASSFLVAGFIQHRKRKQELQRERVEAVFAEDDDLKHEPHPDDDVDAALEDWEAEAQWREELPPAEAEHVPWQEQLDTLCDELFHGSHNVASGTLLEPCHGDTALALALPPLASRSSASSMNTEPTAPRTQTSSTQTSSTQPRLSVGKSSWTRSGWPLALVGMLMMLIVPFAGALWGPIEERSSTTPRYVTQRIEDLQVGDWVLASNPHVTDEERAEAEVDWLAMPETWKSVALEMDKPNGGSVAIKLLRPSEWVAAHNVVVGELFDLEATELEANGIARVLSIDDCPAICPPPAAGSQLVTATFAHSPTAILDLTIRTQSGESESIGVTATHPVWSEDQQTFVAAGELRIGERLRTVAGEMAFVSLATPRGPPEPVYNLEVNSESVYYVSSSGILVHNATLTCKGYDQLARNLRGTGKQANHLNQNAAFKSVIPRGKGMSVPMKGNAFTQRSSMHYKFHKSLEKFWDKHRAAGTIPTNKQYGTALSKALKDAGLSPSAAKSLAAKAARQRSSYGLKPSDPVPNVPRKMYQR